MPRLATALILAAAACGGASPTPAPTPSPEPTPAPSSDAASLWAAVLQPGATFTFDDAVPGTPMADDPTTVVATVSHVEDTPDGRVAHLAWTENDDPMEGSAMPTRITVGADAVTLQYGDDDGDALRFPATAAPAKLDGGLYIDPGPAGELCYGIGPEDDAEECEDVCFAQLCVHPTHGLTGGEGRWWPSFGVFQRVDLR